VDPDTHDVVEAAREIRMDYSQCDVPLLPVFKVVVHEAVQRQALTDSPPAPGGLGYAFYNNRSFAAELARVKASSGARRINTTTTGGAEADWVERTARGAHAAERAGDARLVATSSRRRGDVVGTAHGGAMAEGSVEAAVEAAEAVEAEEAAATDASVTEGGGAAVEAVEATATDATATEGAAEPQATDAVVEEAPVEEIEQGETQEAVEATATDNAATDTESAVEAQATDAVVEEALVEDIEEEIEQGEKQDAAFGDSLEGDSLTEVAGMPVDIPF